MSDNAKLERDWWNAAASGPHGHDHIWGGEGDTRTFVSNVFSHLKIERTSRMRVLDLGCGIGRIMNVLAGHFPLSHFVGVDVATPYLAEAQAAAAEEGVAGNTTFVLSPDGRTLPDIGIIDAAWSCLLFQHLPQAAVLGYMEQIVTRLRSGGSVLFQTVEGQYDDFLDHRMPRETFVRLCVMAGLDVHLPVIVGPQPEWIWVTAVKP